MEKLKAHYSLQEIQVIVSRDGSRSFTFAAQRGAENMGLSRIEAVGVVLALTGSMLYKSMTTNSDNKIWQDEILAKLFSKRSAMTSDARIPASKWLRFSLFAAIFQIYRISPPLKASALTGQADFGLFCSLLSDLRQQPE